MLNQRYYKVFFKDQVGRLFKYERLMGLIKYLKILGILR